jgi:GNAT superfamily N-acetyltransferase
MVSLREIDPIASMPGLLRLWNACLSSSFPLGEDLFLQGLGPVGETRTCIAAFAENGSGPLLGFALVKGGIQPMAAQARMGHLSLILVDPQARGRGIGSSLLGASEAWLKDGAAKGLIVGADRRHFFPGVPVEGGPVGEAGSKGLAAFLEKRGYHPEALEHDLLGPALAGLSPDGVELLPPGGGFSFAHGEGSHRGAGEAFFKANFPGRWTSEFLDFLDSGQDPHDLILLLGAEGKEVLGFCRISLGEHGWLQPGLYWRSLLPGRTGALGPIGVDGSQRGKGLGLALLRRGLQELGARGAGQVVIDWTDQLGFYAPLGFRIWKSYRSFRKSF